MIKVSAMVMASGMSKRMAVDKLHLMINNKSLYEYILDTIKECPFYEVIVAAKDDDILKKTAGLGFIGVRNTKYFLGQSESIKAALIVSKPADGYMFFVADQPFINLDTIKKLSSNFAENPSRIILPFYNGRKGNPVIFPHGLKDQLMSLEGDQGGKVVLNNNIDRIARVDIATDIENIDIDTTDDYERIKKRMVIDNASY